MSNRLGSEELPDGVRFTGVIDHLPDYCDCAKHGYAMNAHKMQRVRNERGVIKFCPHTRHGYIQFHNSGVILDGIFSGNMDGD